MAAIDMSINGSRLVGDARRNAADEADWSPAATTSASTQTMMTKCLHATPLFAETLPTVNKSRWQIELFGSMIGKWSGAPAGFFARGGGGSSTRWVIVRNLASTFDHRRHEALLYQNKTTYLKSKTCLKDPMIYQGRPQDFFCREGGGWNLWLIAPTFLLQCMHIKEKNWCSPNPSVENNLASSLFNCNKIVNAILSEL